MLQHANVSHDKFPLKWIKHGNNTGREISKVRGALGEFHQASEHSLLEAPMPLFKLALGGTGWSHPHLGLHFTHCTSRTPQPLGSRLTQQLPSKSRKPRLALAFPFLQSHASPWPLILVTTITPLVLALADRWDKCGIAEEDKEGQEDERTLCGHQLINWRVPC